MIGLGINWRYDAIPRPTRKPDLGANTEWAKGELEKRYPTGLTRKSLNWTGALTLRRTNQILTQSAATTSAMPVSSYLTENNNKSDRNENSIR